MRNGAGAVNGAPTRGRPRWLRSACVGAGLKTWRPLAATGRRPPSRNGRTGSGCRSATAGSGISRLDAVAVPFVIALVLCCPSAPAHGEGMVDPAIDGLTGPFSYLSKSSTILGGIGASGATQVTWDGALYTGACELCVVVGDPPEPVAVRVKQLGFGYLPIVHYAWQEGEVRCSVSAFTGAVSEQADPVNFVRLGARRMGDGAEPAFIGFGIRHSGLDHRADALESAPFAGAGRYEFAEGCVVVDDRAVCILPDKGPARQYAVLGEPYAGAFSGEAVGLKRQTAALISLWELGANEELSVDLKLPWKPLPLQPREPIEALQRAGHDDYMQRVVEAWHLKLTEGMQVRVPEPKPQDAYRANLVYALMAVEHPSGAQPYLVNRLQKQRLRPGRSATVIHALDVAGHHGLARGCLEALLGMQGENGRLSLDDSVVEHCAVMQAVVSHIGITGDRDWAEAAWGPLMAAAEWLAVPPGPLVARDCIARAAALAAARDAASRLARDEDARALAERWERAADAVAAAAMEGAFPTEVIPTLPDLVAAGGAPSIEERATVWPEQMTALCQRLRSEYAEGVVASGGRLNMTATADMARLHAMRGEQEQAIRDVYALLVHTGSCHEGYVSGAAPWSDRDSGESYPPDPLFAAAYVTLLRDLLVREQGADLHLLSAVSPEWLRPGETATVENARTTFGPVSISVSVTEQGAEVLLAGDWHAAPDRIILHVPYFVELTQASADQPGLRQVEGPPPRAYEATDFPTAAGTGGNEWLELPPQTARVDLQWTSRNSEPISYERTVEEWRSRYRDRYDRYTGSARDPVPIEPPPLR